MGQRTAPIMARHRVLSDLGDGPQQLLLDLRADVLPDGSGVSFMCRYSKQYPIHCFIPFEQLAQVMNTVRQASKLMVRRARFAPDEGASRLMELCNASLRPIETDVLIDPMTGDRLFVHQFQSHAPLAIRQSAGETGLVIAKLHEAVARSLS